MTSHSGERRSAHPYSDLPKSAFWRSAVAEKHFSELGALWKPKFQITPEHRVATFGSCFAQHIGRALKKRGFDWLDTEPPPAKLSAALAEHYNYGVFTCRTANIYTTTLLLQWTRWALGEAAVPSEAWERGGRWYDPFRPAIEPDGFASEEEMVRLRAVTIAAFGRAIRTADCFVFTLGLTESWWNTQEGYEYPTCPGTVAGQFDAEQHTFRNLPFAEILEALKKATEMMRSVNPKLEFVLTVSPVPLTATNSGNHVLVATMESKSCLRAVAGQLARYRPYIGYFPSYEIINSPVSRGIFFEPNMRSVSPMGVEFVMRHFFDAMHAEEGTVPARPPAVAAAAAAKTVSDVVCEEELLDAFGPAS